MNRSLQKYARAAVTDIEEKEWFNMREKFFALDHTAEVLENYRRIQENKIFDRILHDERDKRAFLRREGRQKQHLIENFDQKYGDFKYLEGTSHAGH